MIISPNSDCVKTMKIILAVDLLGGKVVHGAKGNRDTYRPLDWGCASTADPDGYVEEIAPMYLYIADLDHITGTGDNDRHVLACARRVNTCWLDRGCRSPGEMLVADRVVNVIGTETAGRDLSRYPGGILSLDCRDGSVIPGGDDPVALLRAAAAWPFLGCIILNLGSVGTGNGIPPTDALDALRNAYEGPLFYGGGVAEMNDLRLLDMAGFDAAIIATALHRGAVPIDVIRRGALC